MSSDYEWCLSRQAAERIIHLSPRLRRSMLDALDVIPGQPPKDPAATFTGANGQIYFVADIKSRIVTYTIDHAVKRIDVIAIE